MQMILLPTSSLMRMNQLNKKILSKVISNPSKSKKMKRSRLKKMPMKLLK